MKTLIVIILDESESMSRKLQEIISGYNEFVNGQKEITADEASVIFLKFNSVVTIVHEAIPMDDIPELNLRTFRPSGCTALYDAIWEGVRLGEKKEANFDRVLCLIMTDGEENASRMITLAGIRNLLKVKEDGGKWTFLYIGENPERWARQTGISAGNVIQYNQTAPKQNFQHSVQAVASFREQHNVQMPGLFQGAQQQQDFVDVQRQQCFQENQRLFNLRRQQLLVSQMHQLHQQPTPSMLQTPAPQTMQTAIPPRLQTPAPLASQIQRPQSPPPPYSSLEPTLGQKLQNL